LLCYVLWPGYIVVTPRAGCWSYTFDFCVTVLQIFCVTSRHDSLDTSCEWWRVVSCVRAAPCLFQHGGRQRSSSALVYRVLLLLFLFQLPNEMKFYSTHKIINSKP